MSDDLNEKQSDSETEFFDCISNTTVDIEEKVKYQEKFLTRKQKHRDEDRLKYYLTQKISLQNPVQVNLNNIQVSTQPTQTTNHKMSGTPVFDSADPQLQGLTPAQLAYVNQRLNESVTNATSSQSVRVTNINSRIDPPSYNPDRHTSATFFTKCEKYFKSQGCPESQFHNMAHVILKGNMRLWYDSVVDTIDSWDKFKSEFTARFDNPTVQEKRRLLLLTRKQTYFESCEQFIQEMVTLGKQVNPTETEQKSVERAYNALIPDIRRVAGNLNGLTVNSLLEILSSTYDTMKASDRLHKTNTRLPPLYGYSISNSGQFPVGSGRGRGFDRNSSFRPRSYSQPSPNFHLNNTTVQPNYQHTMQTTQNQHFGNRQVQSQQPSYHRQNTQSFNASSSNTPNNFGFRERTFSAPNSNYSTRPQIDKGNYRCHKCQGLGHFAKDCNNTPVTMAIPGTSQDARQQEQSNQYDNSGSLNLQRGASQSYGRGSSQYSNPPH